MSNPISFTGSALKKTPASTAPLGARDRRSGRGAEQDERQVRTGGGNRCDSFGKMNSAVSKTVAAMLARAKRLCEASDRIGARTRRLLKGRARREPRPESAQSR